MENHAILTLWGGLPKRAAWTVCRFKAGGFGKKEGMVLLRMEGVIPQCTLWTTNFIWLAVHEIWKIMQFWHCKAPKNKKIYTFRALPVVWEVYIYLRTPIVNHVLWSFWGVNQLFTTGGSRKTEKHSISSLSGPKNKKFYF